LINLVEETKFYRYLRGFSLKTSCFYSKRS